MTDVRLVALSLTPFDCRGDFAVLRATVDAACIPELSTVLRAVVQQFKRNGMLREADVLAIQDALNARLAAMRDAERAAIAAAEKASKASLVTGWLNKHLMED